MQRLSYAFPALACSSSFMPCSRRRSAAADRRHASGARLCLRHRFEKVTEGVYYATATGSVTIGSNAVVIVNDSDVMLVDPGISAAAATTFLADVKTLTPKPVKYVVDTHYHYDHAFGNQVFGPDVTIIGHDTTWRRLNGPGSLKERTYLTNSTAAIANRFTLLKRQISEATDAKERAIYQRQLTIHQQYADEQNKLKPTPPNATLSRDMTLHRGSREIQIRFFGRAHTDGDIVVFLPRERMVATGDMITRRPLVHRRRVCGGWPADAGRRADAGFRHGCPAMATCSRARTTSAICRRTGEISINRRPRAGSRRAARGSGQADRLTKHAGVIPAGQDPRGRFARSRSHLEYRTDKTRTRLYARSAVPFAPFARSPRTIVASDPDRILRAARYRAARSSRSRWP